MSLVVSDWHDGQSAYLLSQIDGGNHPFSTIVLMLPQGIEPPSSANQVRSATVTVHSREESEPDWMDLCTAPIDTPWFMMTNSYHRVRPNVTLMVADGKPLIPFVPATEEYCLKFPSY